MSAALASTANAGTNPLSALSAPYCPPRPASPQQQRIILDEFIQKLFIQRNATKALNDHVSVDYIQHNPFALSGRQNSIDGLSWISPETVNFTVVHSGIDKSLAWVFSRVDIAGQDQPTAAADFLRFSGSCIEEHWDVLQERPENRTNPLDMW
ncbi:hypothetical protein CEP51_015269 [Fusarium floridanum]|uniref:SnoaL-like domain-containing protein n=2 Tax=Fusarium solani species complex TaxID=232080 RepID=A0A428PDA5_9HYPO|nr:hypothetical protein CEP51_015269 [Fusarium floridanum]